MRPSFAWYVLSAGAAIVLTISAAGAGECCRQAFPRVVYGLSPTPTVIPPTGYVLDPSDAAKPIYPIDPSFAGSGPFARPTYSEGGYAYADSFPYTDDPFGYAYGAAAYGGSAPATNYDPPGPGDYRGLYVRPAGAPPYTAYRYRPAPSAKIIHLVPRG